jgi:hypothetical protein
MAESKSQTKVPTSWVKLTLIPVLVLILVVVLVWPDDEPLRGNSNEGTNAAAVSQPVASTKSASRDQPGQISKVLPRPAKVWPEIAIEEILRHDPFALPFPLRRRPQLADLQDDEEKLREKADKRARELKQLIETLQQKRVSVVFRTEQGAVAVIGSRLVREGGLFEEGLRIVEIRPDGVILEVEDD